jgi:hypothetical protein
MREDRRTNEVHGARASCPTPSKPKELAMRILIALIALAVLAFCGFGFLATYEPPGFMHWRIGYGIAGAACLGVVTWALTSGKPSA